MDLTWLELKKQVREDKKRLLAWAKGHKKFVINGGFEENHFWFDEKEIYTQKELKKFVNEIFDFLLETVALEEKEVENVCGGMAEYYTLKINDNQAIFEYIDIYKWGGYYYKQTKQLTIRREKCLRK